MKRKLLKIPMLLGLTSAMTSTITDCDTDEITEIQVTSTNTTENTIEVLANPNIIEKGQ